MSNLQQEITNIAADVMSVDAAVRKRAEKAVEEYERSIDQHSGFVTSLLQVAGSNTPASSYASIQLKNTVKKCWDEKSAEHVILPDEKELIRQNIIGVTLTAPQTVQANLSEAVALIARTDFPGVWSYAMNHVVATLTENCSVAEKRAALSIGHSLLVKYRQSSLDNSALDVLVSVYAVLSVPLISVMEFLLTVTEAPGNPEALMACKGLESAVECVRDISSMDLGDDFINALGRVANIFMRIFKLHGETFNTCQSELFELKGSVTSCVTHFLTSFDEDFEEYTSAFLQEALLMISENVDNEEAKDLIVKGIGLLCSACIGTGRKFFEDDALLNSLKDRIIVPCLIITDELIEAYTYEPDTYIVHDIEGSDQHTRRRAISDLIRALLTYVPTHSRPLFSNLANQLFETSTNDWRAKDAAIFLASNLCLHGAQSDSQRGVTKGQLDSLIPLDSFLKNIILTEITTNVSDSSPFLIKADCLRVLTAFRNFLDQATFSRLIELFPGFLSCSDEVVRTYTSNALYRFLKGPGSIITEEMVSPSAGALLAALCKGLVEDTKQNFYFMQCLMQICTSVPHCVEPYIGDVVVSLNAMLETAARNPSNPKYGLFLFETISLCISKFPAHASSVEQTIWANLVFVLANDVAEYVPFALQIMSQLLSAYPTSRTEPPAAYLDLLGPLTEIEFYSQTTGAIPGAACLLVTFIERYPAFLLAHPGGLTQKLLNIFLNLIQFKQYDHDGLSILTAMVVHYPRDAMDQYITAAFQFLLRRLESKKTPKFVRIFIIFLSITLVVRGVPDTVARVNAIQPGLFLMIFERIWLADMNKIRGDLERKTCVVAMTNLLTESEDLQSNVNLWAHSVFSCLKVIHTAAEKDDHAGPAPATSVAPLPQEVSSSVFCPLSGAVHRPVDVCEQITDPNYYFKTKMNLFLNDNGSRFLPALRSTLSPEHLSMVYNGN